MATRFTSPITTQTSAVMVVGLLQFLVLPAGMGLNTAYRIVGYHVTIGRTSGAALVDVALDDPTGFQVGRCALSLAAKASESFNLPDPGIRLTANAGFRANVASTVAGGTVTVFAYYYVDFVN